MALINIRRVLYPLGIALASIIGLFVILSLIFLMMAFGVPIHDFNLWRIEKNFNAVVTHHPSDSIFIKKKKYLGGPDGHGSGSCTYAIGEIRSSSKSKDEILQTYKNLSIFPVGGLKPIPIKVLFTSDSQWAATWPLSTWWDELHEEKKSTAKVTYFVYAIHEGYPFWGDSRCDD